MNAIKLTYITLGTTLLLSSCSQEEVIDHGNAGNDRRIIFHTALPAVTTRSQVITKDNFSSFQLTAFNPYDKGLIDNSNGKLIEYINNKPLIKEAGQGAISSEDCLWPEPGNEDNVLTFFAFYPPLPESGETKLTNNSIPGETGEATIDYKMEKFRVAEDIADHVDFVTAYATGSMKEDLFSGIELDFQHQLSRIEIKAWGANKTGNIEIAGLRIGGVGIEGTFNFLPEDGAVESGMAGHWETATLGKGKVEHIFHKGDQIISLNNKAGIGNSAEKAISIMGNQAEDAVDDNCAMVIPSDYSKWDYTNDNVNSGQGMYLSVLLRVTDATSSGESQRYPYENTSDRKDREVVYFAIDTTDGEIVSRIYPGEDGKYFTDPANENEYVAPEGTEIKDFGWAALPLAGTWKAGYVYTYLLDYSYGVGLFDPSDPTPGDPIISDKVGISLDIKGWNTSNTTDPEKPDYYNPVVPVPGS